MLVAVAVVTKRVVESGLDVAEAAIDKASGGPGLTHAQQMQVGLAAMGAAAMQQHLAAAAAA